MSRGRIVKAAIVFVLLAWFVHDVASPVSRSFSTRATLAAIGQYQAHVSPRLRGRVFCRFTPTCSVYGRESVRKYGAFRGGLKAAWRVARCGPWTPAGTFDPP